MRILRAKFSLSLRFCIVNADGLKNEALAKQVACRDRGSFWKEIRSMNPQGNVLPQAMHGGEGEANIAKK